MLLRPLQEADVSSLWEHMSDPQISTFMAWSVHSDKAQTEEFVRNEIMRQKNGKGVTWAVIDQEFCGIVSLIGLLHSHRALIYDKAELAYWLGVRFRGKGIMTEACHRVMCFGFMELGLHKMCVSHFAGNPASERLIRRLGFRFVGTQRAEFQKDGVWHDHQLYELLSVEFRVLNPQYGRHDECSR